MHKLSDNERWVAGEEGRYAVRRDGKVISYCGLTPKILSTPACWDNIRNCHQYCTFSMSGKRKSVHRAVAEAFIPNPENKPTVNHKNGIKTDNKVENLEWATHSENTRHGYKEGLINTAKFSKLPDEQIKLFVDNYILYGNNYGFKTEDSIKKLVTKEDMDRNNVPFEMLSHSLAKKSMKEAWEWIKLAVPLLENKSIKLLYVAAALDIDQSTVCYIRKKKRIPWIYDVYYNNITKYSNENS